MKQIIVNDTNLEFLTSLPVGFGKITGRFQDKLLQIGNLEGVWIFVIHMFSNFQMVFVDVIL